jgi:flagellin-like protein
MSSKRGVSEIVAYVILISITLTVAGMVFAWLKFYVTPGQEVKCPDSVSLNIREYFYDCVNSEINISVQNKGFFDVAGFVVRASNKIEPSSGIYTLNSSGGEISINEMKSFVFGSAKTETGKSISSHLTLIEVQPFIIQDGSKVYCEKVSSQRVSCAD